MASAAEALGMTLPGSSSFPAEYPDKHAECDAAGEVMLNLLEKNILPRDIMTRTAFENAMVLTMILGGSTNAVLHLIAIAHSVGIKLTVDDFQSVSDRVPFIADLKPSGKYVMEHVHKIGGIPSELVKILRCRVRLTLRRRGPRVSDEERTHRREQHDCHWQDARREP